MISGNPYAIFCNQNKYYNHLSKVPFNGSDAQTLYIILPNSSRCLEWRNSDLSDPNEIRSTMKDKSPACINLKNSTISAEAWLALVQEMSDLINWEELTIDSCQIHCQEFLQWLNWTGLKLKRLNFGIDLKNTDQENFDLQCQELIVFLKDNENLNILNLSLPFNELSADKKNALESAILNCKNLRSLRFFNLPENSFHFVNSLLEHPELKEIIVKSSFFSSGEICETLKKRTHAISCPLIFKGNEKCFSDPLLKLEIKAQSKIGFVFKKTNSSKRFFELSENNKSKLSTTEMNKRRTEIEPEWMRRDCLADLEDLMDLCDDFNKNAHKSITVTSPPSLVQSDVVDTTWEKFALVPFNQLIEDLYSQNVSLHQIDDIEDHIFDHLVLRIIPTLTSWISNSQSLFHSAACLLNLDLSEAVDSFLLRERMLKYIEANLTDEMIAHILSTSLDEDNFMEEYFHRIRNPNTHPEDIEIQYLAESLSCPIVICNLKSFKVVNDQFVFKFDKVFNKEGPNKPLFFLHEEDFLKRYFPLKNFRVENPEVNMTSNLPILISERIRLLPMIPQDTLRAITFSTDNELFSDAIEELNKIKDIRLKNLVFEHYLQLSGFIVGESSGTDSGLFDSIALLLNNNRETQIDSQYLSNLVIEYAVDNWKDIEEHIKENFTYLPNDLTTAVSLKSILDDPKSIPEEFIENFDPNKIIVSKTFSKEFLLEALSSSLNAEIYIFEIERCLVDENCNLTTLNCIGLKNAQFTLRLLFSGDKFKPLFSTDEELENNSPQQ